MGSETNILFDRLSLTRQESEETDIGITDNLLYPKLRISRAGNNVNCSGNTLREAWSNSSIFNDVDCAKSVKLKSDD